MHLQERAKFKHMQQVQWHESNHAPMVRLCVGSISCSTGSTGGLRACRCDMHMSTYA